MDRAEFACRQVERVGLGTWSMGGWMWGEHTDERAAEDTLRKALDSGVNLIDTAPIYGFGLSERLVGRVLAERDARDVVLVTKFGNVADAPGEEPHRDGSYDNVLRECEQSLGRLGVDRIGVYLMHWPDPALPVTEAARGAAHLLEQGMVGAIGACNFSAEQYAQWHEVAPLHVAQFRYNLFERDSAENGVVSYCATHGVATMAYSPLARGLLSGKMTAEHEPTDSARRREMFHGEAYRRHLRAVERIDAHARECHARGVLPFALRWVLDQPGLTTALWGARRPEQLDPLDDVFGWTLDADDYATVDAIIAEELGEDA